MRKSSGHGYGKLLRLHTLPYQKAGAKKSLICCFPGALQMLYWFQTGGGLILGHMPKDINYVWSPVK